MTSLLQRDGGIIGSAPTSHTFTLVLGADRRTAIAGGTAAEGKSVSLDQTASGALHVAGALSLAINADSCSGSSVTYSDLTFTVDASDRLTGTGSGTLFLLQGDTVQSVSATMSLTQRRGHAGADVEDSGRLLRSTAALLGAGVGAAATERERDAACEGRGDVPDVGRRRRR